MFKFIEGIEIAQLKILKHEGKIEYVYYKSSEGINKRRILGFEVLEDEEGVLLQLSATKVLCSKFSIDWEETAKLIKEDKMEKIEVRSWEDLERYVICKDVAITEKKEQRRYYRGCVFKVNSLENCVKIFNSLGGNFKYIEIEVIDTLEKWEIFQERIALGNVYYDRTQKNFIILSDKNHFSTGIRDIEEEYNVDLKILKEKK